MPRLIRRRSTAIRALPVLFILGVAGTGLVAQAPPAPQDGAPAGRGGGRGAPPPMSVDFEDHEGFVQIFDGRTMTGWNGSTDVWSVVDGALVAESTPERPSGTTFVFYEDTGLSDFELKLEMKVEGGGNSGIQYRSRNQEPDPNFGRGRGGPGRAAGDGRAGGPPPDAAGAGGPGAGRAGRQGGPLGGAFAAWNLAGYQFDTNSQGTMAGQLFEGGRFVGERGITTRPGQMVILREDQDPQLVAMVADPEDLQASFNADDWNQYHIVVRGNTFVHILNGRVASITIDDDPTKRQAAGVIGIQIEGARRVSARNIWLKEL